MRKDISAPLEVITEFSIGFVILIVAGLVGGGAMSACGPGSEFPLYGVLAAGAGVMMLRKARYIRVVALVLLFWFLWGMKNAHSDRVNARKRLFDHQIEDFVVENERLRLELQEAEVGGE